MSAEEAAALARRFYLTELDDHATYRALAARVRDPRRRRALERIAAMEGDHAAFWRRVLERLGQAPPRPRRRPGGLRLRLLALLQRVVDPVLVVALLELGENAAYRAYFEALRGMPLEAEEREGLRRVILDELEHEHFFKRESESLGLGHVRDFVLGMNDGLVEVLGVVAGLSAVYAARPGLVAASGLVVGVAGALSMAIGAFVSVRSQRQVNEARRERLDILFQVAPERAVEEYRETLEASGVPATLAASVAAQLRDNREALARLIAPPGGENELRSGLYTGLAYLVGAAFPLTPYFVAASAMAALPWAVAAAGTVLAAAGTLISVLSGISIRTKALELLAAGLGAAALSYGFGHFMQGVLGIGVL